MGHTDKHVFDSDFQIGDRMKISKKHAMVYWSHEEENWYIKSICKNAVKVDGQTYSGSPSGTEGKPAKLQSKSQIEIADGTPIFFLLPKGPTPAERRVVRHGERSMRSCESARALPAADMQSSPCCGAVRVRSNRS